LVVSKQAVQKLDGERFNLRKVHEVEIRKQYQIDITKEVCSFGKLRDGDS